MFSLVILLLTCLHADPTYNEWCASLRNEALCDSDFQCIWSDEECEPDNHAHFGNAAGLCGGAADCQEELYNGSIYVSYSKVKGPFDACSFDSHYYYDDNGFTCDTTNNVCAEVEFLVDDQSQLLCTSYCIAYPDDLSCYCLAYPNAAECQCGPQDTACQCAANPTHLNCYCVTNPNDPACQPCQSTSGSTCCAVLDTPSCTSFCATTDTSLAYYCCGRPANFSSLNSQACVNYFANPEHHSSSDYKSRLNCMVDPTNVTACALCDSYYECCSQFKKDLPTVAADICDHFCGLPKHKDDEDCVARQQCIANGGSRETCAASQVRLSSFCVAFLLLIIGLFLL